MKLTKWTKWQAGAVGAAVIALLFQTVKTNPSFDIAQKKALAMNPGADTGNTQDHVMDDWATNRSKISDSGDRIRGGRRGRPQRGEALGGYPDGSSGDSGSLGGRSSGLFSGGSAGDQSRAAPSMPTQTRTGRS